FSSSVLEHINELEKTMAALNGLTSNNGCQIHMVDLRDHFFRYPFEMLCYSKNVWNTVLNPADNLNRLRVRDYRTVFEKYYDNVHIDIFSRDSDKFNKIKHRVKPEFITGIEDEDNALMITIFAGGLKR
ncbi:MAG: hypothetical protein ABIA63_15680, partial [bacterium]